MTVEEAIQTISGEIDILDIMIQHNHDFYPKQDTSKMENRREAFNLAIEALRKQDLKIPVYQGDGYADDHMVYDTWECSGCGKHYDMDGIYKNWKYCPECGQHIGWEEQ